MMVLRSAELYGGDGCPDLQIVSCFSCPLSQCRWERAPGQAKAEAEALRVRELAVAGRRVDQIVTETGLSIRTVYRVAAKYQIPVTTKGRPPAYRMIAAEVKAQIVARKLAGERTVDLAAELGVSVKTVQDWTRTDRAKRREALAVGR